MKPIYNLKNIADLIAKKYPGYYWNYEIYDRKTGKREAKIEDFIENMYNPLDLIVIYQGLQCNRECNLDVYVTNVVFQVYEDESVIMGNGTNSVLRADFSEDWINLLLTEYKDEYAKKLLSYCETSIKLIEDEADKEIANYTRKVKEKARQDISYYKKLKKEVKKCLDTIDTIEITK